MARLLDRTPALAEQDDHRGQAQAGQGAEFGAVCRLACSPAVSTTRRSGAARDAPRAVGTLQPVEAHSG